MQGDPLESTSLSKLAQVATAVACLLAGPPLVGLASAQSLRGVVLDASNRAAISGTAIQLQPDRGSQIRRATTDSAGAFYINAPEAGLYRVTATRLGFVQHRGDTVRLGNSETVTVEIQLDRTAVPLKPVVVTGRISGLPDGFESRRAAGFGRFLTRKDIESRQGSQTSDILRGMPGLVITPVRRGRGPGNTLAMRGPAGLCQPAVWIDGVFIAGASVDEMLVPTTLEAVEVYNSTSTAPIQYRTGNCGVVLFWTKRGTNEDRAKTKWWKLLLGASAGVGLIFLLK
jgi:hypothetical protein